MRKKKIFKKKNLVLFTLITFGSLLIVKNFNNGFWSDEWASFYFSNPSNLDLIIKGKFKDGSSKYYYIMLIWWNKFFGYFPETIRMFSNFFGILSLLIFLKLSREFKLNNEYLALSLSLFVTNFFVIYYSEEARWYSLSLFLSLLNIYFYIKAFKKDKYLLFFIFSSILTSLINIFSSVVLLSSIIHSFYYKKNKLFISSLVAIPLVLIFKLDYILIRLFDSQSIANFSIGSPFIKSFFIGYYFNNFFGNVIFGGMILCLVVFIIFYFYSLLLKNYKINFIILVTFLSYFLPLIYSYLFNPILRDRYILFVVPLIIIFMSYFITNFNNNLLRKIVVYSLIIFSFININFHKVYFTKPPINDALNIILNSNDKNVLIENYESHFNNLISFSKFAKKNNIKFYDNINNIENFWTICLNSPRFATSIQVDDKKCFNNEYINTHILNETIKIPDLVLRNYKINLR